MLLTLLGLGTALISLPVTAEVTGQAALPGKKGTGNIVVWLEGEKKSKPLTKAVVDQRDKLFSPHVSVVTVGTTVQFPNNDSVFHNVFAYYRAKKFDLGMYPRGTSKPEKFDKPGIVAIHCNVHSEMSAYILVVDTPFYAVTDKNGKYTIKDIAPGTYQLHVWHESGAEGVQSLTVHGGANPLSLLTVKK